MILSINQSHLSTSERNLSLEARRSGIESRLGPVKVEPKVARDDDKHKIIELFQKCHADHPVGKFFGECTDLKIRLDRCFREEKAVKRKANFEESKKMKEKLRAYRKETTEQITE
ncbi:hypothetical protein IFM89_017738 [Coptis chinensis]|uniref:COX assembly mitochondrial protein n=1 Tax=Coptis chinensis TaxID=261450 RepID=A0A835HFL8_9MAGN|nr:hypothetical protein IFM89_017738 [Coptis chinensis]